MTLSHFPVRGDAQEVFSSPAIQGLHLVFTQLSVFFLLICGMLRVLYI